MVTFVGQTDGPKCRRVPNFIKESQSIVAMATALLKQCAQDRPQKAPEATTPHTAVNCVAWGRGHKRHSFCSIEVDSKGNSAVSMATGAPVDMVMHSSALYIK